MKTVDKIIRAIDRGKQLVTDAGDSREYIHEARIQVKVFHEGEQVYFDICMEQHTYDLDIEETDFILYYDTSSRKRGNPLLINDLNILLSFGLTDEDCETIVSHYKAILLPLTGFTDEQLSNIVSVAESQHENTEVSHATV
jgi:hypothetical protein